MKPLPQNPEPYLRPKERWFENYTHPTDDDGKPVISTMVMSKTLTAMWLMLHDRTRKPLPKKTLVVNISDREWLMEMLNKESDIMEYWGEQCNNVNDKMPVTRAWAMLLNENKGGHRGR